LFILIVSPAFFAELKKLGKLYHVKAEASAAAAQWQHTLTWQPLAGNTQLEGSFQSLKIKNAEIFGFDHEKLLDIESLSICKNERVLITGASGSGKTVLLDVLAGLREVSASTLQVNNTELGSLKLLQQSIFYVGQQAVFFDGSLFENIGLNYHSREEVAAAIEQVGMDSWLQQQPEGLDQPIGDRIQLSGGQKQKLALARLALFKTDLVLLDEPLAHLSIDEQASVLVLLKKLTETRTSIWISHKPLASLSFDQTWVIDQKTVVQRT
jgi:ATP-binding cassette subfamily C protein CydD